MSLQGPEHLAHVKTARQSLEQLLAVMGWPTDEMAFHRCIDRLLQLEDEWSQRHEP
jgi:hypothetical protein